MKPLQAMDLKKMIATTPPRLREARGFIPLPCIAFFLFHGWLAA